MKKPLRNMKLIENSSNNLCDKATYNKILPLQAAISFSLSLKNKLACGSINDGCDMVAGDASDTLFSVSASGASAGRIALTGAVDRETTNIYSISITVWRKICRHRFDKGFLPKS